jgi:hypothetical protein
MEKNCTLIIEELGSKQTNFVHKLVIGGVPRSQMLTK